MATSVARRGFKKEEEEEDEEEGVDEKWLTLTVPPLTPDPSHSPSPSTPSSLPTTPKDLPRSLPGSYTQNLLIQDFNYQEIARAPAAYESAYRDCVMKILPETQTAKNEDDKMTRDAYIHHETTHTSHSFEERQQEPVDIGIGINTPNFSLESPHTATYPLTFAQLLQDTYIQPQPPPGPAALLPIDDDEFNDYYYNELSDVPFLSYWHAPAQAPLLDSQAYEPAPERNSMIITVTENKQEPVAYFNVPFSSAPTSNSLTATNTYTSQIHPLTLLDSTTTHTSTHSYPCVPYSDCTGTWTNTTWNKSDFDLYLAAFSLPEDVGRKMLDRSAVINAEFGHFHFAGGKDGTRAEVEV
ncbi:hypothetical protein BD410DRAFT_788699 [Rickenella mellea]|uniref:Uncharacterized protein n=1 Tax=Rickenella mellea TaxID=50990 RepID=A0A4Y7Q464_9AGAM|nr:hypothetical protein BD410DRAFT_788699 [Rickenella mellea]